MANAAHLHAARALLDDHSDFDVDDLLAPSPWRKILVQIGLAVATSLHEISASLETISRGPA